ncbi:MAG: 2-amino-4-hydroxy-6-hydroxymethyldihydropteridine diphosphokinase, partial [Clostridia bacterium]|nr:2-amino-4-hydroxy-6-hydroxymethyldihydropteridine diphosphokinase [Clostridia bacterium]
AGMGRIRTKKNGPRVIDLDLLLYEGYEEATPELTVPHPRMGDRAFVLMPLSDLMKTPPLKRRLKELGDNGVKLTTEQLICP